MQTLRTRVQGRSALTDQGVFLVMRPQPTLHDGLEPGERHEPVRFSSRGRTEASLNADDRNRRLQRRERHPGVRGRTRRNEQNNEPRGWFFWPFLILALPQLFAINSIDMYSSGVTLQALGMFGAMMWIDALYYVPSYTGPLSNGMHGADVSWIFGMIVAGVVYWVLSMSSFRKEAKSSSAQLDAPVS